MRQTDIFETTNVDLAAFLMMEGIKFLECKVSPSMGPSRDIVVMRFLDEHTNCRDLERVFMGSEYKKYREFNKYLLREIKAKLRESR